MRIFLSLCFLMLFGFAGIAQQETKNKSSKESKVGSLKKAEKAIKEDNPTETAAQYTNLGNQYAAGKQYTVSNTYYQRALNIYKDLKDNDKQAEILRKIAINNEALNNIPLATSYFSQAQDKATNVQERQLNSNDLGRTKEKKLHKRINNVQNFCSPIKIHLQQFPI